MTEIDRREGYNKKNIKEKDIFGKEKDFQRCEKERRNKRVSGKTNELMEHN